VYPSYNQLERREKGVPVTGRLSASDPNCQNQPRKPLKVLEWSGTPQLIDTHRYFLVPLGFVRVHFDFSQIELRTLAWFCQDENLLRAYRENLDVHQQTAEIVSIDRDVAKQCNFLTVLGGTERAMSVRMPGYYENPDATRQEAAHVLERFFQKFSRINEYKDRIADQVRRNGCLYVSPFGRPRRIPALAEYERWKRDRALRELMSSIISGSAADMMKECMIRSTGYLAPRSPASALKMSIHDELVFDLEEGCWQELVIGIKALMEYWPMLSEAGPGGVGSGVPIIVEAAATRTTWADKKKLKIADGRILNADVIG
jgi:DNA polymerase I